MGEPYTKFVPITKTNLKRPDQRLYNGLLDLWNGTDHELVDGDQRNYNTYSEKQEYRVTYILKWCKKKQIEVPWFDWAVEEKFINLEAQKPENQINAKPVTSNESDETAENRLVLIALMAAMLRDKKLKPHLPFDNQARLGDYIENNYKEKYPQKGLSASKIKKILARANNVLERTKDDC